MWTFEFLFLTSKHEEHQTLSPQWVRLWGVLCHFSPLGKILCIFGVLRNILLPCGKCAKSLCKISLNYSHKAPCTKPLCFFSLGYCLWRKGVGMRNCTLFILEQRWKRRAAAPNFFPVEDLDVPRLAFLRRTRKSVNMGHVLKAPVIALSCQAVLAFGLTVVRCYKWEVKARLPVSLSLNE